MQKLYNRNLTKELWRFSTRVLRDTLGVKLAFVPRPGANTKAPDIGICEKIISVHAASLDNVQLTADNDYDVSLSVENIILHISLLNRKLLQTQKDENQDEYRDFVNQLESTLNTYSAHLQRINLARCGLGKSLTIPSLDDIHGASNDIEHLLRIMPTSVHQSVSERAYTVSTEHILCSVLGLNLDFAESLLSMDESDRNHQTDEYWVERMVESQMEELSSEIQDMNGQSGVMSTLVSLGLTISRAEVISEILITNPFCKHLSPVQWVKRYINNAYDYHTLLRPCDVIGSTKDGSTPNEHLNGDVVGSLEELLQKVTPLDANDNECILYHSTDQKSARHLHRNGIQLGKGRERLDFSDGYGFYLTNIPRLAVDWARHGQFTDELAVVVYRVPKDLLEKFECLDIESHRAKTREDLIAYNRCGRDRRVFKLSKDLKKLYHSVDYVNVSDDSNGGNQVCILTDRMAEAIGSLSNVSVVYQSQ